MKWTLITPRTQICGVLFVRYLLAASRSTPLLKTIMVEISSQFRGPRLIREDSRFECTLPELTVSEEQLQFAMLADKLPKVPQRPWWRVL